jgi:hypothetical protein
MVKSGGIMKDKCFDAGTIQAFLDGELASELLEQVARHVALCDDCAGLLHEAEEESAFAFEILGQEFDALVPTERIRASVFQAISNYEKPKASLWQKLIGLASSFSNPMVASFASILIVFAIFAAVLSFRNQPEPTPAPIIADNSKVAEKIENNTPAPAPAPSVDNSVNNSPPVSNERPVRIAYKPESKVKDQKSKIEVQRSSDNTPKVIPIKFVDGEETYIKTIATLENTVKGKKDTVLRGSSRVAYERDMAVINDSINRMKAEVRKNPKNEAAKQILRNSYQNKIELLNSLSERSDMMASLD